MREKKKFERIRVNKNKQARLGLDLGLNLIPIYPCWKSCFPISEYSIIPNWLVGLKFYPILFIELSLREVLFPYYLFYIL